MPRTQTISRLARRSGVGVETVRYYERRGLIRRPPKPRVGWREYSDEAVATIHYIKEAQGLGFSLAEIRSLLESLADEPSFCARLRGAAGQKLLEVEEAIAALTARREGLLAFLGACAQKPDATRCPIAKTLLGCPKE
jgi:MerR family mercuric resistance operon transcriptional regulator